MVYKKIIFFAFTFVFVSVCGRATASKLSLQTEYLSKNPSQWAKHVVKDLATLKSQCGSIKPTPDQGNTFKDYEEKIKTRSFYSWDFFLMLPEKRVDFLTGVYQQLIDILLNAAVDITNVAETVCTEKNYQKFANILDRILFNIRNVKASQLPENVRSQINALWNATFYFRLYADHVKDLPQNTYPDPKKAPNLRDRWYNRQIQQEKICRENNINYKPSDKVWKFKAEIAQETSFCEEIGIRLLDESGVDQVRRKGAKVDGDLYVLEPKQEDFKDIFIADFIGYTKEKAPEDAPVKLLHLFENSRENIEASYGKPRVLVSGKKTVSGATAYILTEPFKQNGITQIQEFIDQHSKLNTIVLSLPDLHGAVFTYDYLEQLISEAVDYAKQKNIKVIVAIPGDVAERHGCNGEAEEEHKAYGKAFLGSNRLREFFSNIAELAEVYFFVPGNHDTQDAEDWKKFIENIKNTDVIPMSNLAVKAAQNALPTVPFSDVKAGVFYPNYITGNTLFFPYGTNYGNYGTKAFSDQEMVKNLDIFCVDARFRAGTADAFWVKKEKTGPKPYLYPSPKEIQTNKKIAEIVASDEWELSPIAKRTMDNFVAALEELVNANPEGPLNVFFVAHDNPFRIAVMLELLSKHYEEYRIAEKDLKRIHFYTAGGHEHKEYTLRHNIYMTSAEGTTVKIQNDAVGAGVLGSSVGLFALKIQGDQDGDILQADDDGTHEDKFGDDDIEIEEEEEDIE